MPFLSAGPVFCLRKRVAKYLVCRICRKTAPDELDHCCNIPLCVYVDFLPEVFRARANVLRGLG